MRINKATFEFLNQLQENNNRPWFNENKGLYETAHQNVIAFVEELINEMSKVDQLVPRSPKQSLHRIYRDTRFSKDKTPYKGHFGGGLKRDTKWLRGGYYFHLEPGNTFVAGGFWGPNPTDLMRIRKELASDASPLRKIMAEKNFKKSFGTLQGNRVKTAPRGFDKDHPDNDLIAMKQFYVQRTFTDKQALSPKLVSLMVTTFQHMRPYFDYMSEVLTTDENGVPIE